MTMVILIDDKWWCLLDWTYRQGYGGKVMEQIVGKVEAKRAEIEESWKR